MAKDPFSVIDADIEQVRGSVKTKAARRLREGAVIASARDGIVVVTSTAGSREIRRYKKAAALTQRQRHKVPTPA